MGTSVHKIESTYGHIQVEHNADLITKAQNRIMNTGYSLTKPETFEEDEVIPKTHSYIVDSYSKTTNRKTH